MLADRQANRQTDKQTILITILCTPPEGKVIVKFIQIIVIIRMFALLQLRADWTGFNATDKLVHSKVSDTDMASKVK